MTPFLALFRRELFSRWPAVVASFVMGLFLALFPLFLAPGSTSPAELRGIANAVVLASWGALLAILVGASLFSREITGGGFDLRLPATGLTHWAARLSAALALLALCVVALLLPSIPFGLDVEAFRVALAAPLPAAELGSPLPLALLLAFSWILLLLVANAFALALRSRSAWSVLDLASAALLAVAIFASWRTIHEANAPGALWLASAATALFLLPGLLVAGARQLSRGRGEADASQRAHAIALLVASALAAAGAAGFARWYADPSLDDLSAENAFVEPIGGNLAVVGGPVVDRVRMRAYFLLDLVSGKSERMTRRPGKSPVSVARGSADGRRFGWFETDWTQRRPRSELILFATENPLVPESTAISASPRPDAWALSPSAKLVAVTDWQSRPTALGVVVMQISPATVVRRVAIDACNMLPRLWFPSESRLVVDCISSDDRTDSRESVLQVHEIDLESGRVVAKEPAPSAERLGEPIRLANGEEWRVLRRCVGRPCRLVARGSRQGANFVTVSLLDEATGELSELRQEAVAVRDPSDPNGVVLLSDSAGRWARFDPVAGALVPVFPDSLYGRSARVYGW